MTLDVRDESAADALDESSPPHAARPRVRPRVVTSARVRSERERIMVAVSLV
jgi:hypothetical protein